MSKVKIELTPYNSMTIMSFLREFVNDDTKDDYQLKAIHQAVNQYEEELHKNITNEQIEDCRAENQVNQLIGKSPLSKSNVG